MVGRRHQASEVPVPSMLPKPNRSFKGRNVVLLGGWWYGDYIK